MLEYTIPHCKFWPGVSLFYVDSTAHYFGEKILIFTSHFRLFSTYVLICRHDYPSQIELHMRLNHHRHFRKFLFEFVRTPWLVNFDVSTGPSPYSGRSKSENGSAAAGARSKNSATNHSTFQKKSELFSIGGGHVVPVVNNTTCFSKYKWLLFLLLFSSYFPLLSHSFLK